MAEIPQIPNMDGGRNQTDGQRYGDEPTIQEILEAMRENIVEGSGSIEDTIVGIIQAFGA